MNNPLNKLGDAIEKSGVKITFGLQEWQISKIESEIERWNNIKIDTFKDEKIPSIIYSKFFWVGSL